MTPRPHGPGDADRPRLLRRRSPALARAGVTLLAVATLGGLLLAPNRLASARLGEWSLAWWTAGVVGAVAVGMLAGGVRDPRRRTGAVRWGLAPSLGLVAVWGSPALWLGLPPLILADGTAGIWPAAAVAAGVVVAVLMLGGTTDEDRVPSVAALARQRWPGEGAVVAALVGAEVGVGVLFAAAQFAAVREIGTVLGGSRTAVLAVAGAAIAAGLLPGRARLRAAALAGSVGLLGLSVPVVAGALATGATWGAAWSAAASRPRLTFSENSPWTTEGRAVRGPGSHVTVRFTDGQRVTFESPGAIVLGSGVGGEVARNVAAGERLSVQPGDRLTVPQGMRLRFQAGRRVPDGPGSGPEWADGRVRPLDWPVVVGLGVTVVLGTLGLGPASGPPAGGAPRPGAGVAAGLVLVGVGLAAVGALQAARLTPEVYAGGVTGSEIFEALALAAAPGTAGYLWGWLALGGLAAGAVGALLAGPPARAVAAVVAPRLLPLGAGGVIALGAVVSFLAPAGAWTLLVTALGLAAAVLAPAAVALAWSERAAARAVAAGAGMGLAGFTALALLAVAGHDGGSAGLGGLAAWPAALAAPAHALVVWGLRSRRGPAGRGALAPRLGAVPGDPAIAPRRGR